MPTHQNLPNPKQLAKLAKQLDPQDLLRFIKELTGILSPSMLEAIKTEAEQARILCQLDGIEEPEELDEQPARHFEYKKIKHKHYAYLRWREDGHHKSEYLGSMPLLPDHTYTLIHKKNGNSKTLTSLGLEIKDDKIYLKVQVLNPIHSIRSYPYPECLNTVLSKKEWAIQKVASPSTQKKESLNSNPSDPQDTPILSVNPEVRNAGKSKPRQDTWKLKKTEPVKATTGESCSKLRENQNSETFKDKETPILKVPHQLVPQVYATLKQWENLSQSLRSIPQWTLLDQGNKVTLRTTQENETIIEYNKLLGTVTIPHPVPILIEWLQLLANEVSTSQLVGQDTKTQAIRLKTRLQGTPQDNIAVLLAYLLGLPVPDRWSKK